LWTKNGNLNFFGGCHEFLIMLYFVWSSKPPALLINRPMSLEPYDDDKISDGEVDNEVGVASYVIGDGIAKPTNIVNDLGCSSWLDSSKFSSFPVS
jgi:hypothetical protein